MTTTSEVLLYARDLIAQGFTKGELARDAKWEFVAPDSPQATAWCSNGAITCAIVRLGGNIIDIDNLIKGSCSAIGYLSRVVGRFTTTAWNDAYERTQADVIEAFDHAARLAKDAGD